MSFASPASPTQWQVPHDRNPRPAPPRRPSAMRSSSSDHIITPAVTRFDPDTADIPPSPTFAPDVARSPSPATSAETLSSAPPPPPSLAHRAATSPASVLSRKPSLNSSPPAVQTSLLARRRSSRSTARPDFLPKLDDLKLPSLPVPPLEELDDTIRPEEIGHGSQATTPFDISPTTTRSAQEAPFKPTRTYASTPFPKGRRQSFFDGESEDDDDKEEEEGEESGNSDDDDDDGRSTAESSVLDESTDGFRRLSMTEVDKPASVCA